MWIYCVPTVPIDEICNSGIFSTNKEAPAVLNPLGDGRPVGWAKQRHHVRNELSGVATYPRRKRRIHTASRNQFALVELPDIYGVQGVDETNRVRDRRACPKWTG